MCNILIELVCDTHFEKFFQLALFKILNKFLVHLSLTLFQITSLINVLEFRLCSSNRITVFHSEQENKKTEERKERIKTFRLSEYVYPVLYALTRCAYLILSEKAQVVKLLGTAFHLITSFSIILLCCY